MMGLAFLLAVAVYVYLATLTVRYIKRVTESQIAKYITVAVFVLIPTWDIIPGQIYHQYLCSNEAGVRVFRVAEVNKSYFRSDGKPDEQLLADRYVEINRLDRTFSQVFHIKKLQVSIQDKTSGESLGEARNFSYSGGWIGRTLFQGGEGVSCPEYPHFGMSGAIWMAVVKPAVSSAEKGGK